MLRVPVAVGDIKPVSTTVVNTTARTFTTSQQQLHNFNETMMIKADEERVDATIKNLQYLSIWDDGESSSPLMDQTNRSLNSSDHSATFSVIKTTPPTSPAPSSHPSNNNKRSKRDVGGEYELKNARDALVGSISAVINFLSTSGVPKPACDQLQKNLDLGRYFAVMKRVQDYIQCLPSLEVDDIMAKIHLSVTAWEALTRFKTIEYKRAYKLCFKLRYELKGTPSEIKAAIAAQITLAEQCTACQKKLYLVQKWQRYILQKMKRSTMIEPQGYQPIRCL